MDRMAVTIHLNDRRPCEGKSLPPHGERFERTAGSHASPEVGDKGKPGESRRRKATRLTRATARYASRAADSHYRGGRVMRAFILAVTGLAFGVTACSSGGTSVIEVEKAPVASISLVLPAA